MLNNKSTSLKVLIVGEDSGSTSALREQLGAEGTVACPSLGIEDGIAKTVDIRPDAIILDLGRAAGDPLRCCTRLGADRRTAATPIIVLTPRTSLAERLQAFAAGAADCLVKPCDAAEVVARVRVHAMAKRRIDQLEAMAAELALQRVAAIAQRDERLFAGAQAYLRQRLSDPPRLAEVACELGTTEKKLTELFRNRLGMTVSAYLHEMRLETARHILAGSNIPIQIVANEVGYGTPGDFARAFRRRYSVTPREFRQAMVAPSFQPPE